MDNHALNINRIIGMLVLNSEDVDKGRVETILLDLSLGEIIYVVLSFSGFLGRGQKLFIIPWSMFSFDYANQYLLISIDKHTLRSSPSFDHDHWPDTTDRTWHHLIHSHFNINSIYDRR